MKHETLHILILFIIVYSTTIAQQEDSDCQDEFECVPAGGCLHYNKTNRSNDATLENPLTFMFHSNVYMSKEFQGLFKDLGGISKELQGVSKEFNGAF